MNNNHMRVPGLFIPAEILEMEDLSFFEMLLLSWIDALYCPQHGGCYASNEYLGKKVRSSKENSIAKALTRLRKKGLIEDISFNGKTRVIRALIHKYIDKKQSKSGLDKSKKRVGQTSIKGWTDVHQGLDRRPSSPYIDNKEDRKGRRKAAQPLSPPPSFSEKNKPEMVKFGEFVELKKGDYEILCDEIGKDLVDYYIQSINNYIPNAPKQYKSYASVIRQWYLKDKAKGSLPKKEKIKGMTRRSSPKETREEIEKLKKLADRLEGILRRRFTANIIFESGPTKVMLVNKSKDFYKEYEYEDYDLQTFKEEIRRGIDICFPGSSKEIPWS